MTITIISIALAKLSTSAGGENHVGGVMSLPLNNHIIYYYFENKN